MTRRRIRVAAHVVLDLVLTLAVNIYHRVGELRRRRRYERAIAMMNSGQK